MPVREIKANTRSITGRHGVSGQQFESSLERDLLDLLAFDPRVERCEAQPLTIRYPGPFGDLLSYTPDFLVWFRKDLSSSSCIPPLLIEVKYREEYRSRFHELRCRFRHAYRFARERGWRFRVFTEREIRTPYLENARFLRPFRDANEDPVRTARLGAAIGKLGATTPKALIELIGGSDLERAQNLSSLWKLTAEFRVLVDLKKEVTMHSLVWLP